LQPQLAFSFSERWQRSVSYGASDARAGRYSTAPKVLIVEDEFLVASSLENTLRDAGFEVIGIAASGEEAIEIANEARPDIAIVDIRLNGKQDGVFTAIELRKSFGVPTIFASAHVNGDTRTRAASACPAAWVEKPYEPMEIVAVLHQILNGS
jgi:two-component system, response regulator PdtaR